MRKIHHPSKFLIDLAFEEMFCQRDEAYDSASHSTVTVHLLSKSSGQEQMLRKNKTYNSFPKIFLVENFLRPKTSEQEDTQVGGHDSHDSRSATLKVQRHRLEKDVLKLQKQLQQEVDLHYALENAFGHGPGIFPNLLPQIPANAQELLADIAILEATVSNLEEQMIALNFQLGYEQRERQKAEHGLSKFPMQVQDKDALITEQPTSYLDQTKEVATLSASTSGRIFNWSPNAAPFFIQHSCCALPTVPAQPLSPRACNSISLCSGSSGSHFSDMPARLAASPSTQTSPQNFYSGDESGLRYDGFAQSPNLGCKHLWQQPSLLSPEKVRSKPSGSTLPREMEGRLKDSDIKNSWQQPNRLSQEMVHCMMSIYRHLADPADGLSSSLTRRTPSPNSPYGHVTSSSLSSLSESSGLSFTRTPAVDLQNKDLGTENSFDPYRAPEKLPWADIGNYGKAIEVSEMCVGREQLEYAAEALRMFRSLVEQLSRVDPSNMTHEQKLAFWINVYNALMMHAYLAYGVPKNDFKFISLMQKAAYTVGGHSFNAVIIEHLLLKVKPPSYRPQIALLLAHQKMKLTEDVKMFAIDRVEPLVTLSLSFGATSSPAVRVYTAENVQEQLHNALQDYARASVGISAKGKLLVPQLLYDFSRDKVDESAMPSWICQFLPCTQSSLVRNCLKHRQHKFLNSKNFAVIPFDFRFRYLFLLSKDPCTV